MATRVFSINPGEQNTSVNEAVGPTATSGIVSVVIDLATNITDQGSSRAPSLEEVIKGLEDIKEYIMRNNTWPPA
jgi:hypothetical protein